MKDIHAVLRHKEQEMQQLAKEVEALKTVIAMLSDEPQEIQTAATVNGSKKAIPDYSAADKSGWTPAQILAAKRDWP